MPEPRNPKLDPRPGDVLKKGARQRTVLDVGDFFRPGQTGVFFKTPSQRPTEGSWEVLEYWQRWAKNAEVLHSA
jgi:hypothetical protein